MNQTTAKILRQDRRRSRVKAGLGTAHPRLVVRLSNLHARAQIIDDQQGTTLVTSTSSGQKLPAGLSKRAEWVGADIAKKAKDVKISKVVFDRGPKSYHGRIKVLAEAARKNGLEF